jgi:hypothetical protein
MLNCGDCGLTHRPYDVLCSHCGRPLQEPAAAEAKRREWDALSPRIREDMERNFDRSRQGTLDHLQWLKRHRLTHVILGAMLVNLIMNGATVFAAPWTIPLDLFLGAGAGLALNRWRGGAWRGTGVFAAAGLVSLIVKVPVLGSEWRDGGWLLISLAVFFLGLAGYLVGLTMDYEHADRSVTP